ncbi:MAG: hypothetical protein ABIY70_09000 [Capsulimonas sp.]|uniref:hypothetical protein n=1 Tax=Capsulimonas sp. TaxID=2494211 RepID=UPI003265554A
MAYKLGETTFSDEREANTVLAALRFYQTHMRGVVHPDEMEWAEDLATDGGKHEPPTVENLDEIIERIYW